VDQTTQLIAMTVIAAAGVVATLAILRGRDRAMETPREPPFAASSEGEMLCPKCGMGNLWTDSNCIVCGARLPGSAK
jgi:hypothetical protein